MKKILKFGLFTFVIFFLSLVSCLNVDSSSPSSLTPHTATIISDDISSTPIPTLSKEEVEQIVYDPNYLNGCKGVYPDSPKEQLGFQGIYSGISTNEDVIKIFGSEYKYSQFDDQEKEYLYIDLAQGFIYSFYFKNNTVENIAILKQKYTEYKNALGILEEYGCPDLIVAMTFDHGFHPDYPTEIPSFEGVSFYYFDAGLIVNFRKYPIELTTAPDALWFGIPLTFDTFSFDQTSFTPVSFLQAVEIE